MKLILCEDILLFFFLLGAVFMLSKEAVKLN